VAGATALWNGVPLVTTVVSASQATASVPAGLLASIGSPAITMLNPDGTGSAPAPFTIPFGPENQIVITFTAEQEQ